MIRCVALSVLLMSTLVVQAQQALSPQDVLKKLGKFGAYGEIDRRDMGHVYLNVQFRNNGPKPADLPAIAGIVKQSSMPVMLNCNGASTIDDAAIAPLKGIDTLMGVGLSGTRVGDKGLATVGTLRNLQILYISSDNITDAGIKHLSGLIKMRKLSAYCKKVTPAAYVHIEKMMELEELTLGEGSDQTDKTLPHIKGLTKLRELSLKSGATTDVGMGYLKNMTGLRRLRIEGEKITAVGLQHIAGLDKLEMLSVSGCPPFVTEAGFSCVKGMKALKDLSVYNCGSPDEKASQHLKALTSLKILRFSTVQKGSLEGLRGHPCIEDLQLYYSYAGPDDIAPLIDVTTLKSLSLMNTRVTDAGLKHLKNLKQLRSLHLGETRITDAGFADLAALTGLEDLIVSENKLTGSGLKHLGALPKLTRLSINGNPLKDEAVAALKELKNAREINLTGTRMSLEATQALKKALPKARIRDMAGDDVELTPRKKTRIVTGVDLSTRKPEFTMTAAAFHAEYKKDRTAATEKYKKKVIELSGTIDGIGRNISGDPYVTLKVEKEFIGVMCITREDTPWVKALPGQTVKIKGEFPEFAFSSALVNCSLVEVGKSTAVTMTAEQFAKEYAKDSKAMGEKYKDNYFILTGKVIDREFNSVGAASVTLESRHKVKVKCSFTAFEKDGVKALKMGDEVKIAGQYALNFGDQEVCIYFSMLFPKEK